jgi:hypothetical protein
MSILIKGINLPKDGMYLDLVITEDGLVRCYDAEDEIAAVAVELPTADELAEDMRTAAKIADEEASHSMMDGIMCRLLCEMGYEEAVAIFDDAPKWYA